MNHAALITSESKLERPILVVDKEGKVGEALTLELKNESIVIYVSKQVPADLENIVHIPFVKRIPSIPDNTYSYIFLIDEHNETPKELLKEFIRKAKKDNSKLCLIINKTAASKAFITDFVNEYENAKAIIIGEIFKKDQIYDSRTTVNKFIAQANLEQRILIPGDGTKVVTPVYFDDVITGILDASFGADEKNKIVYLFPKHGITLLSLANIFKKHDPDLRIDFAKEAKLKEEVFLNIDEGNYLLGEKYDLEGRIKKIDLNVLQEKINKNEQGEDDQLTQENEKIYSFKTLFALLIFLVLLPLLSSLLFALLGGGALMLLKNSIETNNLVLSKNLASLASGSFLIANASTTILSEEAGLVGQSDKLGIIINDINSGREIASTALSLIDASDKLKSVILGETGNSAAEFSSATVELKNAFYLYSKEEQKGLIPKSISSKLGDSIKLTSSTIDFWQDLFGFNGSRSYLILFENNMELRPGGGFIGSYGILSVNQGRIVSFNIFDVYDADGQLKGHVEPPFPIRRYLPMMHWFLRDSNFNIDFSKGAVTSAGFLNTEMHQTVDGVIGVDSSFVKNILAVVGPVKVNDYNQTVDANNFFKIAQAHAEKDFFPGSTQKKNFLKSFYNSLQLKLASTKNLPYLPLMQVVTKSVYEKHLVPAFNNANEEAAFAVNGWSSALVDGRISDKSTINDFVGINEANLGGNKVNYYLSRSLTQKVSFDSKGNINENLEINFTNSAPISLSSAGIYKNYLRIILPLNATLSSIEIGGKGQKIVSAITDPTVYEKKGFIAPDGLEVERQDQGQNTIYGFLINIQPQQSLLVQVKYVLPKAVDLTQPEINYSLKIFKQPGIDSFQDKFSLNFPASFRVLNSSPEIKTEGTTSQLSTTITRDREVSVDLTRR